MDVTPTALPRSHAHTRWTSQPVVRAKSAKLADPPSFGTLTFRYRLQDRNSDFRKLNADDSAIHRAHSKFGELQSSNLGDYDVRM